MTRFLQNLTRKWKPFLLDGVNIQLLSNYIESSVIDLPANPQNVISPSFSSTTIPKIPRKIQSTYNSNIQKLHTQHQIAELILVMQVKIIAAKFFLYTSLDDQEAVHVHYGCARSFFIP